MNATESLVTVTARYPPDVLKQVERIARSEDRTVAYVLRRLLRKALQTEKVK